MRRILPLALVAVLAFAGCAQKPDPVPTLPSEQKPAAEGRLSPNFAGYAGLDEPTRMAIIERLRQHELEAQKEVCAAADEIYKRHGVSEFTQVISNNPARAEEIRAILNDQRSLKEAIATMDKYKKQDAEQRAAREAEKAQSERNLAQLKAEEVLASAEKKKVVAEVAEARLELQRVRTETARMNAALDGIRAAAVDSSTVAAPKAAN